MFPPCHQTAVSFAQSHLGFPADVLERFGLFFQSELERSADFGWVAGGPGAFNERTTSRRIPGFRDRPLPTSLTRGLL